VVLLAAALGGCGGARAVRDAVHDGSGDPPVEPGAASQPPPPHALDLVADAWPAPVGARPRDLQSADMLTDRAGAASVFRSDASSRSPWTFIFRVRGGATGIAGVTIDAPSEGCRPRDVMLFTHTGSVPVTRDAFRAFVEGSVAVGAATLPRQGRAALRLASPARAHFVWFRVMTTADDSAPCLSDVRAVSDIGNDAPLDWIDVAPVDISRFAGGNFMGFPQLEPATRDVEGSGAAAPVGDGSGSVGDGSGSVGVPTIDERAYETAPAARP
jgi:hypothetical protein